MNNKILAGLILSAALTGGLYYYVNFRKVYIINVHQDHYSASIIVDQFPYSDNKKIKWWLSNRQQILEKYKINPFNENGAISYYFYEIGEGYQPLEQQDRICFDDMQPPANCLDKNLLMKIQRTRGNNVIFSSDSGSYLLDKDNKISKLH
ncbi:hypothetical protein HA48_09145 [Pantoea wallisii]|uniref:Uncharacterized protein n=1 Tax=Pantoea wallisii TaxID=1076551 RepID=A0A1X1D9W5_9GAMM|nr:DUF943 family protein [Pantoea wallisii]ORM73472.1 hypothetical protein HA48_09145 [Pantoea wallisii]